MSSDDDEKVGPGRPPKHARFRDGESGNEFGRPRKPRDTKEILRKLLKEQVAVNGNGRTKKLEARELVLKQLLHQSIKGNTHCLKELFRLMERHGLMREPASEKPMELTESDCDKMIRQFQKAKEIIQRKQADYDAWIAGEGPKPYFVK